MKPLKFKVPMSILSPNYTLPSDFYPSQTQRESKGRAYTLCCFSEKKASAKIAVDKSLYGNSEDIIMNIETNLSEFNVDLNRIIIEVKKIVSVSAVKTNPDLLSFLRHTLGNKVGNPQVSSFSDCVYKIEYSNTITKGTRSSTLQFNIPIPQILNGEHCFTMRSSLISCQFVIKVNFEVISDCFTRSYFEGISQPIVILPYQQIYPVSQPPISAELWKSEYMAPVDVNSLLIDQNNCNKAGEFVSSNKNIKTEY